MATAKKMDVIPEERYIQDRLKDGTCVKQEFSMRVLGKPDTAYQARVEKLDVGHAKRFADHLQDGGVLWPVVVFQSVVGRKVRALLADGFHRHHAYASLKRPSIPAYVVTVADDQLEHETRLYAAMCNQLATKSRTPGDIQKAVEMLLADPECQVWSSKRIGDHCGITPTTAQKYRDVYLSSKGIESPEFVVDISGRERAYRRSTKGKERVIRKTKNPRINSDSFRAKIGRNFISGATRESVREEVKKFEDQEKNRRSIFRHIGDFSKFLIIRYIFTENLMCYQGPMFTFSGLRSGSAFIATAPEPTRESLYKAIVDARLLPYHAGVVDPRRVVVCYPEDYPAALLDLARKDGIEFLTPDELVASLKKEGTDA